MNRRVWVALALGLCLLPGNLSAQDRKMSETVFRDKVNHVRLNLSMSTHSDSVRARENLVQREICDVELDFRDQGLLGRVGVWKDGLCDNLAERDHLAKHPTRLRAYLASIQELYQEPVIKGALQPPIPGPPGPRGVPGIGISCWDTNQNGVAEASEDKTGDGRIDTGDCQGGVIRDSVIVREQVVRSKFPWKPVVGVLVTTAAAGIVLCVTDVICPDTLNDLNNDNINVVTSVAGFVVRVRLN